MGGGEIPMRTISRRLPDKPVKRWNRNRMWYRVCPIKAYIACIFRRKQGFLGPIDLVDDFSQFSGSVLQDFSGELLIVTSFCMCRIDNDRFTLDNALFDCNFHGLIDQHVEQIQVLQP